MHKLLLLVLLAPIFGSAQSQRQTYINTFKIVAVQEMQIYGIPASITLAQGILESGDGTSRLAKNANNHFGIKCHDWAGAKFYHDDDSKNECFRKYKHAEESYRDHSEFLKTRSRYAALFDLSKTDYEGWAKGLLKAGYATNKNYDNLLIKIIVENNLHQYDVEALAGQITKEARILQLPNRAKYVALGKNERLEDLAKLYKKSNSKILKYNDLTYEAQLKEGDMVFVKHKKWKSKTKTLKVKSGDTMHSISQTYGVKLKWLYKHNKKPIGWQPAVGETIKLR